MSDNITTSAQTKVQFLIEELDKTKNYSEEVTDLLNIVNGDTPETISDEFLDTLGEISRGQHSVFDVFSQRNVVRPMEKLIVRAPTFIIQGTEAEDFFV